jgi:hypothetical protein
MLMFLTNIVTGFKILTLACGCVYQQQGRALWFKAISKRRSLHRAREVSVEAVHRCAVLELRGQRHRRSVDCSDGLLAQSAAA